MNNLETVRAEIEQYFTAHNLLPFRCMARLLDPSECVYWDCAAFPDFRPFLELAEKLGVQLICLHSRPLKEEMIEGALELLADIELDPDTMRHLRRELERIGQFTGFTCQIEMSFEFAGRTYAWDATEPWFDDFEDVMDEIRVADDDPFGDGDSADEPIRGYFSNN